MSSWIVYKQKWYEKIPIVSKLFNWLWYGTTNPGTIAFKKMMYKLQDGFPNEYKDGSLFYSTVATHDMRTKLKEDKYVVEDSYNDNGHKTYKHTLGPSGILLISSWEAERLSKIAIILSLLSLWIK